jgi:hypothetical protein
VAVEQRRRRTQTARSAATQPTHGCRTEHQCELTQAFILRVFSFETVDLPRQARDTRKKQLIVFGIITGDLDHV